MVVEAGSHGQVAEEDRRRSPSHILEEAGHSLVHNRAPHQDFPGIHGRHPDPESAAGLGIGLAVDLGSRIVDVAVGTAVAGLEIDSDSAVVGFVVGPAELVLLTVK